MILYTLGSFQFFAPKLYQHYDVTMQAIHGHYPDIKQNFSNSIYPATTFNLGPKVACFDHVDRANLFNGICAITGLGTYNPKTGGHIVLWDLKMIIEFPPGSTILIPSATLRHSNIPIQAGETRYSMTQYAAGGLFRTVKYGFRTAEQLKISNKALLQKLDEEERSRWLDGLGMFSKLNSLHSDRMSVFNAQHSA